MVFHRHHHGRLYAVRNVGWSGDEQKISTWHAASHHALLFSSTIRQHQSRERDHCTRASARARGRAMRPILSVRGRRDQAFKWPDRAIRQEGWPSLVRQGRIRCSGILKGHATAEHTALLSAIRARAYPVPVLDRPRQVGVWHIQKNDQGRSRREAVALAGIRYHPVD